MNEMRRALLVDDNPQDRMLVARELRKLPRMSITEAINNDQLSDVLRRGDFDVVITDFHLCWTDGLEVLRAVKAKSPECPVIMYTGTGSEEIAVEAMKLGLDDYIIKSIKHLVRLGVAVDAAIERAAARSHAARLSAKLDDATQRSRLLFDASSDGICVISPNRGILEVNASFTRMIGIEDPSQVVGMTALAWDEVHATADALAQHWKSPESADFIETRFHRPDGSVIDVEISATPTEQFGETMMFYICRDVTNRNAAAAALKQSEQHLEAAQIQAGIGSWECDSQGNTLVWSREMYRLFGRNVNDGIPSRSDCLASVVPEDRKHLMGERGEGDRANELQLRFNQLVLEQNRDSPSLRYRYRIRTQAGDMRHLEETVRAAEVSEDGSVTRWIGTTMDVSEKVWAEQELRESKERFERALANIPDAVVIYDTDFRIQFINDAATRITNRPISDFLGHRVQDIWPPDVCEPYLVLMREGLNSRRAVADEFRVELASVGSRHLSACCFPLLWPNGEVREIVSVIRDLTEQSKLQDQLLHAQKMECIGQLAGGIAHDFNNLLTVILNSVELARLRSASTERASDLDLIELTGKQAAILTRQLLTFSRQDAANPTTLDFNQVVTDVCPMLERLLGERVRLEIHADAPSCRVFADAGQLEQVLVNLAVNASDAMPDGGRLEIRTSNQLSRDGQKVVRLAVTDTGVGMDEATRQHIFEPFFTTKPAGKGTGLGLSTVYGIVQQTHGEIFVKSKPGIGTTFYVQLPLVSDQPSTTASRTTDAPAKGSESILVVEDDEALRSITKKLLESFGYNVQAVGDGRQAIEWIEGASVPVQLVFTDAVMPNTSGWHLAEYLATHHPEVRVLCTSGYLGDSDRQQWEEFDTNHFIPKPYSMSDLASKVRAILDE